MDRSMVVKVAMADHFQFKVMPSIKNFCLLKQGDVHYTVIAIQTVMIIFFFMSKFFRFRL